MTELLIFTGTSHPPSAPILLNSKDGTLKPEVCNFLCAGMCLPCVQQQHNRVRSRKRLCPPQNPAAVTAGYHTVSSLLKRWSKQRRHGFFYNVAGPIFKQGRPEICTSCLQLVHLYTESENHHKSYAHRKPMPVKLSQRFKEFLQDTRVHHS